jgi:heme oxygenase
MGSVAKRLGQLAALSLESESSKILRTIQPNKVPNSLSQRLDTTLKDSHDMKVFGMGTLASMASRERYLRFTHAMYGVYSTMEEELDRCSVELPPTPPILNSNDHASANIAIAHFWNRHSEILRRADKLKSDILDISPQDTVSLSSSEYTTATEEYRNALRDAGTKDREDGGGRLLGHAYTRYLADLMGGQVLGTPTRLALGLESDGSPQQYSFTFPVDRKKYVEDLYYDLNEAGRLMDDDDVRLEDAVAEARAAFGHNVKVYSEEPFVLDSVIGLKNIISGWVDTKIRL